MGFSLSNMLNLNYDDTQDVLQDELDKRILSLIQKDNTINTEKMVIIYFVGSGFSGHWEIKD